MAEAVIKASILVINPPKYGITVVSEASIPNNNQLGCPAMKNTIEYSKN